MQATRVIFIGACALAPGLSLSNSMAEETRVEVGKPAIVSVAGAERNESAPATGRLVVTIKDFVASPGAPVVGVVTATCRGTPREIGRFGPMQKRWTAHGALLQPQRFGFELLDDPACLPLRNVTITLEPQLDTRAPASMTILGAEIEEKL